MVSQPLSLRWYWSLSVFHTGVVKVMPWNRDANGKLFGAVWKGRKDATGKFHGAAVRKYFKTYLGMKFFMCIYSLWAAWGKSEFFTRSAWREFIFFDKSITFSMRNGFEVSLYQGVCCIQEIYPNTSWQARYWVNSFARSWKMFGKMWS